MIASFAPIVNSETKILILGTMPGAISLEKQEYYGNKNNQFWKIIFTVFSTLPIPENFESKKNVLLANTIGLWDVLANCERKGSLDIHIKNQTENDIETLLVHFPKIKKILFNGKESHRYFLKKFGAIEGISFHIMPSTSPANTMKFEDKLGYWHPILLD